MRLKPEHIPMINSLTGHLKISSFLTFLSDIPAPQKEEDQQLLTSFQNLVKNNWDSPNFNWEEEKTEIPVIVHHQLIDKSLVHIKKEIQKGKTDIAIEILLASEFLLESPVQKEISIISNNFYQHQEKINAHVYHVGQDLVELNKINFKIITLIQTIKNSNNSLLLVWEELKSFFFTSQVLLVKNWKRSKHKKLILGILTLAFVGFIARLIFVNWPLPIGKLQIINAPPETEVIIEIPKGEFHSGKTDSEGFVNIHIPRKYMPEHFEKANFKFFRPKNGQWCKFSNNIPFEEEDYPTYNYDRNCGNTH